MRLWAVGHDRLTDLETVYVSRAIGARTSAIIQENGPVWVYLESCGGKFMPDFPRAALFVENRTIDKDARPLYARVSGGYWDSVLIEVSLETYITPKFTEWVKDEIFGRLRSGGSVRIAILAPTNN